MRAALLLLLAASCGALGPPSPPSVLPRHADGSVPTAIHECRGSVLVDYWGATCEKRCVPPLQVDILCSEMIGISGWSEAPLAIDPLSPYAATKDPPDATCDKPHWRVWLIDDLGLAGNTTIDFGTGARTISGTSCAVSNLIETPSRMWFKQHPGLHLYQLTEIFPTD